MLHQKKVNDWNGKKATWKKLVQHVDIIRSQQDKLKRRNGDKDIISQLQSLLPKSNEKKKRKFAQTEQSIEEAVPELVEVPKRKIIKSTVLAKDVLPFILSEFDKRGVSCGCSLDNFVSRFSLKPINDHTQQAEFVIPPLNQECLEETKRSNSVIPSVSS